MALNLTNEEKFIIKILFGGEPPDGEFLKKINYEYLKNTPGVKTEFEMVIEAKESQVRQQGVNQNQRKTSKIIFKLFITPMTSLMSQK